MAATTMLLADALSTESDTTNLESMNATNNKNSRTVTRSRVTWDRRPTSATNPNRSARTRLNPLRPRSMPSPSPTPTAEDLALVNEIRALPDIAPSTTTTTKSNPDGSESTVTSRLHVRRLERHNTALREMRLEMEALQDHTNVQFRESAQDCRSHLETDTVSLEKLMRPLETEQTLIPLELMELETLWDDVEAMLEQRVGVITEMMTSLETIEQERKERVADVLRVHGKVIHNIAFVPQQEVDRLLFHEAQSVNEAMLQNRVGLANIRARLLTNEVMLTRKLRHTWETRQKLWAQLRLEISITDLKTSINNSTSYDTERNRILKALFSEDATNHEQQRALVTATSSLSPESMEDDVEIDAKIAAWRDDVADVLRVGNETRGKFIAMLQMETESSEIELYGQVSKCKIDLVRSAVLSGQNVHSIVDAEIQPVLEQQLQAQVGFIDPLHHSLVRQTMASEMLINALCVELDTQLGYWKQFRESQQQLRQQLQLQLTNCSQAHSDTLTAPNNQIDVLIDAMRNAEVPEVLSAKLDQALAKMTVITERWAVFATNSSNAIHTFNVDFDSLLKTHSTKVEAHINFSKTQIVTSDGVTSDGVTSDGVTSDGVTSDGVTSDGVRLLDLTALGAHHISPSSILPKCYGELWQEWLHRLEDGDVYLKSIVDEEQEKLKTKMEIFETLHNNKIQRIREDVFNVRNAELAFHRDRVCRHARAMENELDQAVKAFEVYRTEVGSHSAVFVKHFEQLQAKMPKIDNIAGLNTLQHDINSVCDDYQSDVRDRIRSYRKSLDAAVRGFRESNGALRTSFRTFSEGGNFSSAEITEFTTVLVALGQRIHDTETKIHSPLNEIGTKEAADTDHRYKSFESQFHFYLEEVTVHQEAKKLIRNAHIHVRSHVAACNAQSNALDEAMTSLGQSEVNEATTFEAVCASVKTIIDMTRLRAQILGTPTLLKSSLDSNAESPINRLRSLVVEPPPEIQTEATTKRRGKKKFARFTPKWAQWKLDKNNCGHFIATIHELRVVCRTEIWRDIARPYYDNLHGRALVRSDLLEETPQHYITWLEGKLDELFAKADSYVKQSAKEFDDQLNQAVQLFELLASQRFESVRTSVQSTLEQECATAQAMVDTTERTWRKGGATTLAKLRPAHGHPQNAGDLAALEEEESSRHQGILEAFNSTRESLDTMIISKTTLLLNSFDEMREKLFSVLDKVLLPCDVEVEAASKTWGWEWATTVDGINVELNRPAIDARDNTLNNTIQQIFETQVSEFGTVCVAMKQFKSTEVVDEMMKDSKTEWRNAVQALTCLYD